MKIDPKVLETIDVIDDERSKSATKKTNGEGGCKGKSGFWNRKNLSDPDASIIICLHDTT